MRLLVNDRFAPYRHPLECLVQTLHGSTALLGLAGDQPTQVEYSAADDEASVAALTDVALRLEQMTAPNPKSINDFIHAALEFPRDTPCIFPLEVLYKSAEGNKWITRAVAEFAKDDPTSRRLAGCLCGWQMERQLQNANLGKDGATIGQRLAAAGIRRLEGYQAIDFVGPNPSIRNLSRAMELARALRIRNDSVHLNPTEPSQSEIETLIITALEIDEILKAIDPQPAPTHLSTP